MPDQHVVVIPGQVPGAIPNGSRVRRVSHSRALPSDTAFLAHVISAHGYDPATGDSGDTDLIPAYHDGDEGTVLSSVDPLPGDKVPAPDLIGVVGYFVQWDDYPHPVFIAGNKIVAA